MKEEEDSKNIRTILEKLHLIDRKIDRMNNVKDAFEGEKILDNQDLCLMFNVSERTLLRYRKKGLINYYKTEGKTYYKASEVEKFLEKCSKGK